VVAAPTDCEEPVILLAEELSCSKVLAAVAGGDTRAESVRAGLGEVEDDAAVVLVHDAARPLLSEDVIERLLTALNEGWDGVVPALPIRDTVKRVDGEQIAGTVDRTQLVLAQTPQAFVWPVLRDAVGDAQDATDCASLVEARGGRIKAVTGDPRLVKITDQSDLELVEGWL
jgi:2-C-methyl-D-erythritol 4-phosphate cytidylyltransferase